jgi:galactosylceramidase
MLKVEIGGDGDSTEGSESSHAHVRGEVDCHRGYEWSLMKAARARNPNITLYGLPWAFPNWLNTKGASGPNPLINIADTTGYIADWLKCAEDAHGLSVDIIGVWNEKDDQFAEAGIAYIKGLRKTLDSRGLHRTRIIGGDVHSWAPEDQLSTDPDLAAAMDVLCRHYPSTKSDPAAKKTGKPLWSSEDYAASNTGSGGRCEARILNQNWVNGMMSATINWNLVSSYYQYQTWSDDGFAMTARSPWSGHYKVQPPLWASAHTTQFTAPGMTLLPVGTGSGTLAGGGSFVSYWDSSSNYLSVVVEKVAPEKSACGFSETPAYKVSTHCALRTTAHSSLCLCLLPHDPFATGGERDYRVADHEWPGGRAWKASCLEVKFHVWSVLNKSSATCSYSC